MHGGGGRNICALPKLPPARRLFRTPTLEVAKPAKVPQFASIPPGAIAAVAYAWSLVIIERGRWPRGLVKLTAPRLQMSDPMEFTDEQKKEFRKVLALFA